MTPDLGLEGTDLYDAIRAVLQREAEGELAVGYMALQLEEGGELRQIARHPGDAESLRYSGDHHTFADPTPDERAAGLATWAARVTMAHGGVRACKVVARLHGPKGNPVLLSRTLHAGQGPMTLRVPAPPAGRTSGGAPLAAPDQIHALATSWRSVVESQGNGWGQVIDRVMGLMDRTSAQLERAEVRQAELLASVVESRREDMAASAKQLEVLAEALGRRGGKDGEEEEEGNPIGSILKWAEKHGIDPLPILLRFRVDPKDGMAAILEALMMSAANSSTKES